MTAPAPERLAWHKLYLRTRRANESAKAEKDLRQAATLLAVLVERDNLRLASTAAAVPGEALRTALQRLPSLQSLIAPRPRALDEFKRALRGVSAES